MNLYLETNNIDRILKGLAEIAKKIRVEMIVHCDAVIKLDKELMDKLEKK